MDFGQSKERGYHEYLGSWHTSLTLAAEGGFESSEEIPHVVTSSISGYGMIVRALASGGEEKSSGTHLICKRARQHSVPWK